MKIEERSALLCREIAQILEKERESKGLSANKLAELTGLNRQAISFVERSERTPSIDTFARICLALDLDPEQVWRSATQSAGLD